MDEFSGKLEQLQRQLNAASVPSGICFLSMP